MANHQKLSLHSQIVACLSSTSKHRPPIPAKPIGDTGDLVTRIELETAALPWSALLTQYAKTPTIDLLGKIHRARQSHFFTHIHDAALT